MRARRVLIAEDQLVFSHLLEKWLSAAGYEVKRVENGRAAADAAQTWLPDVVLMDLRMPLLDGFAAARAIRSNPATSRIPIVATTSLEHPEDILEALAAGCNKYLRKPYQVDTVLSELEEVLFFAERRQRIAALAPRLLRPTALVRLDVEQDQMFLELLRSVQQIVPCDLLAMGWRRGEAAGLVLAADAPELPAALEAQVTQLAWRESNLVSLPTPHVIRSGRTRTVPDAVLDALVQAVVVDGECLGVAVVGRLEAPPFSADERRALRELMPQMGNACQSYTLYPQREIPVERVVQEFNAVLVTESVTAEADAAALEACVGGLKVTPLPSLDALADVDDAVQLALVAEPLFASVPRQQAARRKARRPRLPAVKLDPAVLSATPRQLAAWLVMSVLIGIMDGARSGTLHLLRRGGGFASLLVFKNGRVAWGSAQGGTADLLSVLEGDTQLPRSRLLEMVQRCQREGLSLADGLLQSGLADARQYEKALRTYLTHLTGELLREEHPVVYWSQLVCVSSDSPTFDVGDIAMSGMVP